MLDLLITGGLCPDFEKNCFAPLDVGVKDGRIACLLQPGSDLPQADFVIDARGKIVSPGFIDIHMHEENFQADGEKYIIGELMLKMGVTTACGGNCGIQNQPIEQFKEKIRKLNGSPVNYVMLAGYNQIRYRLGLGHHESLTEEKRAQVHELLREELDQGAFGISFGIEYDPAITFEEMTAALSLLDDPRYLAAAHFRDSVKGALPAIEEMIRLARVSGVKFQISHLGSCAAYGQMGEALALINQSMEELPGLDYDTYPYNAFSTLIGSEVFEKESLEQWCEDIGTIMLTEEPYRNQFCTEALLKEARTRYPEMLAVGFVMREEEIAAAVANRYGMIASDGILNHGNGHPRAAGTFPRVLGKYVREEKRLSLIDALRKMTLKPAQRLCLDQKGRIDAGADADLTIFDPETIIDGAAYDNIYVQPEGIDYVVIGGKIAMDHKAMKDGRAGRFIEFKR